VLRTGFGYGLDTHLLNSCGGLFIFRVTHPGIGLPEELVHEMFDRGRGMTQEGLGLSMCRKLVKLMNGNVQYIRETGKSYFLVEVELPLAQRDDAGSVR
jgi:phytochrome B